LFSGTLGATAAAAVVTAFLALAIGYAAPFELRASVADVFAAVLIREARFVAPAIGFAVPIEVGPGVAAQAGAGQLGDRLAQPVVVTGITSVALAADAAAAVVSTLLTFAIGGAAAAQVRAGAADVFAAVAESEALFVTEAVGVAVFVSVRAAGAAEAGAGKLTRRLANTFRSARFPRVALAAVRVTAVGAALFAFAIRLAPFAQAVDAVRVRTAVATGAFAAVVAALLALARGGARSVQAQPVLAGLSHCAFAATGAATVVAAVFAFAFRHAPTGTNTGRAGLSLFAQAAGTAAAIVAAIARGAVRSALGLTRLSVARDHVLFRLNRIRRVVAATAAACAHGEYYRNQDPFPQLHDSTSISY